MAYKKSDPRHPMNAERTGASTVTRATRTPTGMADRKAKPKMNVTTGKYCK